MKMKMPLKTKMSRPTRVFLISFPNRIILLGLKINRPAGEMNVAISYWDNHNYRDNNTCNYCDNK